MNNRSLIILLFYFMYKFGDEKSNRITINIALWESCIFIQDWTKSLHHHSAEEKKNKLKYFISITHIFFFNRISNHLCAFVNPVSGNPELPYIGSAGTSSIRLPNFSNAHRTICSFSDAKIVQVL